MIKLVYISFLLWNLISYQPIPDRMVQSEESSLKRQNGIQYVEGIPYSGYVVTFSEKNQMLKKEGFLEGKREGSSLSWDESGQILENRNYSKNKRLGIQTGFFPNGKMKYEYTFRNDLPIGKHREWLENGQLFSVSNYNQEGQPDGLQQRYYSSGKMRANFVLINGRRYGFLGAKGCMGGNEKNNFKFEL